MLVRGRDGAGPLVHLFLLDWPMMETKKRPRGSEPPVGGGDWAFGTDTGLLILPIGLSTVHMPSKSSVSSTRLAT